MPLCFFFSFLKNPVCLEKILTKVGIGGGGVKCTDVVATKPSEFANAYWEFGAFEVYQAS